MKAKKITVAIWVAWVHDGCEYSQTFDYDGGTRVTAANVTSAIARAVGRVCRVWDGADIVAVLVNPTNEQIHHAVFHVVAKRGR